MSGPLLWLQNCLNRTANDCEDVGLSQAVPLVPLTEASEDAMESKSFQKLLRKLGIRPPESEQEQFWRIPAKISSSQLRCAAAALTPGQNLEENFEEGPEDLTEEPQAVSNEQRGQALRALLLARNRKRHAAENTAPVSENVDDGDNDDGDNDDGDDDDGDDDDANTGTERSQKKTSTKRSRVLDDDEEEEEEEAEKENNSTSLMDVDTDSEQEEIAVPVKRRRKMVLIDEEED